eukprot:CAMPEP_0171143312 /NCGR_PEP_ID=MMETSP0766_2-20121228/144102_1 /TAXON_ID=439317 /ORGANISM="Gambierdiscus australes, Strain CAWD 149" /LENGTH=80 /DNA_ID=CAMNT_0011607135 /DNA_START=70 /DNA_END=309 /DNA_ORIENTATION=-
MSRSLHEPARSRPEASRPARSRPASSRRPEATCPIWPQSRSTVPCSSRWLAAMVASAVLLSRGGCLWPPGLCVLSGAVVT